MPNHEEHCLDSMRKYGKRFDDLHAWMDEPSILLGKEHRIYRHDPKKTPPIAKKLFGELADQACLDHIRLDRLEKLRVEKEELAELRDHTEWFLNFLFPPIPTNKIRFINIPIYYNIRDEFSDTTEVVKKLAEYAVEKYGIENVNVRYITKGKYLRYLMEYGFDKKSVQIFFIVSLVEKPDKKSCAEYLTLPDKWSKTTGSTNGMIVSLIALHTFRVPYELTYGSDAFLFKNSPASSFDHTKIKKLIGEEVIRYLDKLERERKNRTDLLTYSVFNTKGRIGLLNTPLAAKNYLKEVEIPVLRAIQDMQKTLGLT